MRLAIIGVALLGLTLTTTAEAAPHHKTSHRTHYTRVSSHRPMSAYRAHSKAHHRRSYRDYRAGGTQYLPHPPGCPRTAFCGCGAAYRAYGATKRALWQAAAWFGFARTSAAPGMAAVRSHHVFILERHVAGNDWLVTDYNSGNHQSRLHVRSIAGYAIVNPHS